MPCRAARGTTTKCQRCRPGSIRWTSTCLPGGRRTAATGHGCGSAAICRLYGYRNRRHPAQDRRIGSTTAVRRASRAEQGPAGPRWGLPGPAPAPVQHVGPPGPAPAPTTARRGASRSGACPDYGTTWGPEHLLRDDVGPRRAGAWPSYGTAWGQRRARGEGGGRGRGRGARRDGAGTRGAWAGDG
jgi:hypothetical protein